MDVSRGKRWLTDAVELVMWVLLLLLLLILSRKPLLGGD